MKKSLLDKKITRKEFLQKACAFCLGAGFFSYLAQLLSPSQSYAARGDIAFIHEAKFYRNIDDQTVQCMLCPRGCTLSEGQRSFCRVREPRNGKLYTLAYGEACSIAIDPVEKKPFFHFLPGISVFSLATAGCNFRCKYCQNWDISQSRPEEVNNYTASPQDIVERARRNNCPAIAYTYTEPVIFYEYMRDTAKIAQANGIRNLCHTNGSFNPQPLREISMYLDAVNVDLKAFTQDFYTEVCAGFFEPTLTALKILKDNKVWVEITNLVIPTLNDDMAKIKEMCVWIKDNLGADVPLHFSRFWPQYKLTSLPPTPLETLEQAWQIGRGVGLHYVYIGNVAGHPAENTYCSSCQKPVIQRRGYTILRNDVVSGKCKFCGVEIAGVWS